MTAFYLTLLAVLVSGFGGRDQITVAGLVRSQGERPAILVTALGVVIATAIFAAWAAMAMFPIMQPHARLFLCAMALAIAAVELLVMKPRPPKGEPTHSLGALSFVLLYQQLTDSARFVLFAMALALNGPVVAAAGGALGGMALLCWAWAAPNTILHARVRLFRRVIGVVLLCVAAYVGMNALRWI